MKKNAKSNSQDYFIGEIMLFASPREIEGWLPCDGRLLNVKEYNALYSILGNDFGGDGRHTFALPDLCGVVPVGMGRGNRGLSIYPFSFAGGAEQKMSNSAIVPVPDHTHVAKFIPGAVQAVNPVQIDVDDSNAAASTQSTPAPFDPTTKTGNILGKAFTNTGGTPVRTYISAPAATTGKYLGGVRGGGGGGILNGDVQITAAGTKDASIRVETDVRQPYLALNYLICVQGEYPPLSNEAKKKKEQKKTVKSAAKTAKAVKAPGKAAKKKTK